MESTKTRPRGREWWTNSFSIQHSVSVCLGINSIWRSCFFWIRHWKHFWMKAFFSFSRLHLSSSWQRLSLPRLLPWTRQENSNCVLYFERYGWSYYTCAKLLFKNFQGGNQLINKQGIPNATEQNVFILGDKSAIMSWKNKAVSSLHFPKPSTSIAFIAWSKNTFRYVFLWMALNWHRCLLIYTSTVFRSFKWWRLKSDHHNSSELVHNTNAILACKLLYFVRLEVVKPSSQETLSDPGFYPSQHQVKVYLSPHGN